MMEMMGDVVVTAKRAMAPVVVKEEVLGDLRLYRVPMPTDVAAHGQKQVALMAARRVKLALIHRADVNAGDEGEADQQARIRLRMENRKLDGLGLALPAGGVAVVQQVGTAALPVGEGAMEDKAVGETANVEIGASPQVHLATRQGGSATAWWRSPSRPPMPTVGRSDLNRNSFCPMVRGSLHLRQSWDDRMATPFGPRPFRQGAKSR
jgi:hypothetical protein